VIVETPVGELEVVVDVVFDVVDVVFDVVDVVFRVVAELELAKVETNYKKL
jgi:hypothetical protein